MNGITSTDWYLYIMENLSYTYVYILLDDEIIYALRLVCDLPPPRAEHSYIAYMQLWCMGRKHGKLMVSRAIWSPYPSPTTEWFGWLVGGGGGALDPSSAAVNQKISCGTANCAQTVLPSFLVKRASVRHGTWQWLASLLQLMCQPRPLRRLRWRQDWLLTRGANIGSISHTYSVPWQSRPWDLSKMRGKVCFQPYICHLIIKITGAPQRDLISFPETLLSFRRIQRHNPATHTRSLLYIKSKKTEV